MKKIFSLVLTLIMLATLFSACDSRNNENGGTTQNPSISDIFGNYTEDPVWVYQSATGIPELSGKTELSGYAGVTFGYTDFLKVFYEEGGSKIDFFFYNVKTGSIVLTKNAIDEDDLFAVEFFTVNDNEFFSFIHGVRNATSFDFSTTVYNANGTQIAYAEGIHAYTDDFLEHLEDADNWDVTDALNYDSIDSAADLLRFDNTIYKIAADGTATILKEKSPFTIDLPNIEFYNEKYYIEAVELDGYLGRTNGYVFYNTSLEVVSSWAPEYILSNEASNGNVFMLNNGTLLVQNMEVLPDNAQEYDLYAEGTKVNISSFLINPETGAETALDNSFVVYLAYALDAGGEDSIRNEAGISDKYENLASIMYIKDRKVSASTPVMLDNEGKIVCELFTNLPNIAPGCMVDPFADGIFVYESINGTDVYINANGEKLLETDASFSHSFGNYFIVDDAIYDKSFNLVYDFGANGYELMGRDWSYSYYVMSDSILLTKYDAVYLFTNDTPTLIIENGAGDRLYDVDYSGDYYVVRKPSQNSDYSYSYHYYNARGQFLFASYGDTASRILSDDGIALFRAYNVEGNAYYYRVTK